LRLIGSRRRLRRGHLLLTTDQQRSCGKYRNQQTSHYIETLPHPAQTIRADIIVHHIPPTGKKTRRRYTHSTAALLRYAVPDIFLWCCLLPASLARNNTTT
jgi:hypothetical protein